MNAAPDFLKAVVSRETLERLSAFVELLISENGRQNLIAASTIDGIWIRHILDGLQLLPLAPHGQWLDVGSGAGLPGLVVAIARPEWPIVLVEPRTRRAQFLCEMTERLALPNVVVKAAKVEMLESMRSAVISARAVARLDVLFTLAQRHSTASDTVWLLPKGRSAAEELAITRRTWQGDFRLIPSLTDPEASIIMARNVRRKAGR